MAVQLVFFYSEKTETLPVGDSFISDKYVFSSSEVTSTLPCHDWKLVTRDLLFWFRLVSYGIQTSSSVGIHIVWVYLTHVSPRIFSNCYTKVSTYSASLWFIKDTPPAASCA